MPSSADPSFLAELPDWEELIAEAMAVRSHAYCPYSGYAVGAAIRDNLGRVYSGVNVENVSYGATICAERSAVCRMVAQGGTSISKVAVVTADGGFPCGVCLQVLLEFNHTEDQMQVALVGNEAIKLYSFADLLPRGFSSFQNGSLRNPTTL